MYGGGVVIVTVKKKKITEKIKTVFFFFLTLFIFCVFAYGRLWMEKKTNVVVVRCIDEIRVKCENGGKKIELLREKTRHEKYSAAGRSRIYTYILYQMTYDSKYARGIVASKENCVFISFVFPAAELISLYREL